MKNLMCPVEIECLGSACGVPWSGRWSNERVRRKFGVEKDVIGQIQIIYCVGKAINVNGRMVKKVKINTVKGLRGYGGTRKR